MKRNGPDQGPNQEPGKPAGKPVEPPADQQAAAYTKSGGLPDHAQAPKPEFLEDFGGICKPGETFFHPDLPYAVTARIGGGFNVHLRDSVSNVIQGLPENVAVALMDYLNGDDKVLPALQSFVQDHPEMPNARLLANRLQDTPRGANAAAPEAVKFDKRTGRLEVGPGMIVQINKDVIGKGYYIEPLSGFDGKDPFGGYRWKNLVAAKAEAPKIAQDFLARAAQQKAPEEPPMVQELGSSPTKAREFFSLEPSPDMRAMAELIANGMAEQLTNALPENPLGQYIAAEAMFQAFNDRINDLQAEAREGAIREVLQRIHDVVDNRISAVRISSKLEQDDDDVARYAPSFEFEWDEDGDGEREFVDALELKAFEPFLKDDPLQMLRDLTLREMEYHTDPFVVRL